jgi:hypothetical protein
MKIQYLSIVLCLVSLIARIDPARAEGELPSDIITQAIKEDRTILQIRGTPVTDREIERWVWFLSESERRALNLTTAQVVKVLRRGRTAGIRPGQSLLISEAATFTYIDEHDHNGISGDEEHPIQSAAALEEGAQYLYIVDQVQTINKKRGKEKASFSIARELNRKGVFKIVPPKAQRGMEPTITTAELNELMPLFGPNREKGRSKVQAMSSSAQKTKLGERVAKKLEATNKGEK